MRLSRQQRREARELAREAWIESRGDSARAKSIFEAKAKTRGIDPGTLLLLLQIALQLWKWWQENQNDNPSVVESSNDGPGYALLDEDFDDDDTVDLPPSALT